MPGIIKSPVALGPRKEQESVSISELYHENTKLHPQTAQPLIDIDNLTQEESQAMANAFKYYSMAKRIPLPPIGQNSINEMTFDEVIASRRSVRNFSNENLKLEDLSKILFQSYGVTGDITIPKGGTQLLRAAPSAGALYPAEIYLGIRKVDQVEPGIYHYHVPNHELELLNPGDMTEFLFEVCCQQEYVKDASVIVLISGVLKRTKRKYGERGYRYVYLDVGHLGQNIYLACTALGMAVMTTCGFFDDMGNKLLKLDGVDETLLYVAFLGPKKSN